MLAFRYAVCALLLLGAQAGAQSATDRALALKQRFMAPCCWSETLAEHRSPAASELNAQIDQWVSQGVSDQEIERRLVAQHGRRILAEPGGAQGTILRVVPFAFLVLGGAWVILLLRRWLRTRPAVAA